MTENDQLKNSLEKMMKTTTTFDNFQQMMKKTRSFDEEYEQCKKESEKAVADAFIKMINLTQQLERHNAREIMKAESADATRPINSAGDKFFNTLSKKLPVKYSRLPIAFKRNPRVVTMYFLGMIFGRILAILLYIVAAFIPAIPLPEGMGGWIGRPLKALGGAVMSIKGVVADPSIIISTITSIPTDINKILQKIGEFFQFYGRRFWAFLIKIVKNPKLAYEDLSEWSRRNVKFFVRLCRSAVALTCSFIMIKLAMIFLLPLFGGIAITVLGLKISVLLFVVVRMIVDKIGETIGTRIFATVKEFYKFCRAVRTMLRGWEH